MFSHIKIHLSYFLHSDFDVNDYKQPFLIPFLGIIEGMVTTYKIVNICK